MLCKLLPIRYIPLLNPNFNLVHVRVTIITNSLITIIKYVDTNSLNRRVLFHAGTYHVFLNWIMGRFKSAEPTYSGLIFSQRSLTRMEISWISWIYVNVQTVTLNLFVYQTFKTFFIKIYNNTFICLLNAI